MLIPYLSPAKAEEVAKQLLTLISNPYAVDDHQFYCTVSIGISVFPSVGSCNIDVLRQADTALYRAKASGRNKFMFYEPEMQAQVESFLEIEKACMKRSISANSSFSTNLRSTSSTTLLVSKR